MWSDIITAPVAHTWSPPKKFNFLLGFFVWIFSFLVFFFSGGEDLLTISIVN